MQHLRRTTLSTFKSLHRTRQEIFAGDDFALKQARQKINDEFRKNLQENSPTEINKSIKFAKEVEAELKKVVQAKKTQSDVYRLNITESTPKLDNVMYNEDAIIEKLDPSKKCKPSGSPS